MSTSVTPGTPVVGELAPDFTLPSTAGADVSLADRCAAGPVLLAFFPLAFTSTCTAELCAFSEDYSAFAARGVQVLPISVDSVPTLREYRAKYALEVELLSDFHRHVSRLYDVLLADRFYSARAYFLIDRDGVLRWRHVERNPSHRRENAELLAEIDRLG